MRPALEEAWVIAWDWRKSFFKEKFTKKVPLKVLYKNPRKFHEKFP
jgi:hypothetical protein